MNTNKWLAVSFATLALAACGNQSILFSKRHFRHKHAQSFKNRYQSTICTV